MVHFLFILLGLNFTLLGIASGCLLRLWRSHDKEIASLRSQVGKLYAATLELSSLRFDVANLREALDTLSSTNGACVDRVQESTRQLDGVLGGYAEDRRTIQERLDHSSALHRSHTARLDRHQSAVKNIIDALSPVIDFD